MAAGSLKEMIDRMGVGGAGGPEFRVLTYACIWDIVIAQRGVFFAGCTSRTTKVTMNGLKSGSRGVMQVSIHKIDGYRQLSQRVFCIRAYLYVYVT
jgi:hypothetical protein